MFVPYAIPGELVRLRVTQVRRRFVRPRAVALVSCDPAALARDARTLTDLGYPAAWVQPVDLFPQTAHVDALTALHPATATSG